MLKACVVIIVLCQNVLQYGNTHFIHLQKHPVSGFFSIFQEIRTVRSKIQCAVACAKLKECSAISFSRNQSMCMTSSETGIYVIDGEWITMRTGNVETKQDLGYVSIIASTSSTTTVQTTTAQTSYTQTTQPSSNLGHGIQTSSPAVATSTSCPSGYTSSPGGSCFRISTETLMFKMAIADCKLNGGQLCTVLSSSRNADLVTVLATAGLTGNVYLGAMKDSDGEWAWRSGNDFDYSDWMADYPGAGGSTDTCLVTSREIMWKWMSVNCADPYHYVCEPLPVPIDDK